MRNGKRALIAEYKRRSPWSGLLTERSVEDGVRDLHRHDPRWISILVDELWGGSYEDLERARGVTDRPLLAKGRSVDPELAARCGANAHLAIGRSNGDALPAWVEVHDEAELEVALRDCANPIVVNNRDLGTGQLDAVADRLAPLLPDSVLMVAASGYTFTRQAPARADYVLIGEALLTADRSIL